MKAICESWSFSRIVAKASKIIGGHLSDITDGIFIEAKNDCLRFKSTDMTISFEGTIPARVVEPGTVVLNGNTFSAIAAKLPIGDVEISSNAHNNVKIKCKGSNITLQGFDAKMYPASPGIDNVSTVNIPQRELKLLLNRVAFAAVQEQTRPILAGVNVEIEPDGLTFVALDGYRLAHTHKMINTNANKKSVTIPSKGIKLLVPHLDNSDIPVKIMISDKYIGFELNGTTLSMRLLDGEYPQYRQIISTCADEAISLRVDTWSLDQAVQRSAIISRETSGNMIKMKVTTDNIELSANAQNCVSYEIISIDEFKGINELEIAFNPQYILDVIRAIDSEWIKLSLKTSTSPILIETEDTNEKYVVLPCIIH